ncbi:MAG: type II toxin-antitoxin system HicA family toxin [Anaerolineae bacterium]|nr:type II toxin-antitoxin system HicA family toxin [Anaerolineae bacterium]
MSKREKRLQKLRHNPIGVSFEDLKRVLEDAGFVLDHATGSHHVFRMEISEHTFRITIPFARPVKSIYVKQAIALIDEMHRLGATQPPDDDAGDDNE